MNCRAAKASITRWLNGERDQPVANMIKAAGRHAARCRQDGCVKARMRLDHQPPEPRAQHATGAP